MTSAEIKRLRIIEAAKRRFSHFGIAKTTMAEIAKDLAFSKALLYYYFPDKNRLYAAVWELLIDELLKNSDKIIEQGTEVEGTLFSILDLRMKFIKDYYNIYEHAYMNRLELPEDLQCEIPKIIEHEHRQIANIFKKGAEKEGLIIEDEYEVAKLFMMSLVGMRSNMIKEFKSLFLPPSKEEFEQILTLQKKMTHIFVNGLRRS